MKIEKSVQKRIEYCILTICFALLCFFILKTVNTDYQTWLSIFAVIIVVTFLFNLVLLHFREYKVVSFFIIFVALLYLFHFGQVILYGFFPSYKTTGFNFIKKGTRSVIDALLFSYLIINFIVAGGMLAKKNNGNKRIKTISRENYFFVALFFICISLPMQIYMVIKSISISQTYGYGESLHLGFSGAFTQIANFYIIGFVMLLLLNRNNKTSQRIVFFIEICFLLFSMLSGSRIYAMTSMVIIFIVYLNTSKISLLKEILIFIVLLIILQFVVSIAKVREASGFNLNLIIQAMFDLNNNVIFNILEEFGSSIASVYTVIEQVPDSLQYAGGITYLKSLAGILINIPGFDVYGFVDSACYIKQLSGTLSYGGSLIGELYFNFGFYISLPISFLIGYVAGLIDRRTTFTISKGLNLELPMLVMVLYSHIIWVRGYFSNIVRAVAWAVIIIYIMYELSKKLFSKKEVSKCCR